MSLGARIVELHEANMFRAPIGRLYDVSESRMIARRPVLLHSIMLREKFAHGHGYFEGLRVLFSDGELNHCLPSRSVHEKFFKVLKKWQIRNLSEHTNCIPAEYLGRARRLVLSWEEIGRIASDLGAEFYDVARFGLAISKFAVTLRPVPSGGLPNRMIREMIARYLGNQSSQIPPALVSEIRADGTIHLCDYDGRAVKLKVTNALVKSYSLAEVRFTARSEIVIRFYQLQSNKNEHHERKVRISQIRRAGTYSAIPFNAVIALKPPTAKQRKNQTKFKEHKSVQAWAFGNGPLECDLFERKLQAKGVLTLATNRGCPCKLSGLTKYIVKGRKTILNILLSEKEVRGEKVKIARVFPKDFKEARNHPDQCLEVYIVRDSTSLFPIDRSTPIWQEINS